MSLPRGESSLKIEGVGAAIRATVIGLLTLAVLGIAAFAWVRGWIFPGLLITVIGLLLGWGWIDSRFIYMGRVPRGGSSWRGPSPHEGWSENQADRDAWIGGDGGF